MAREFFHRRHETGKPATGLHYDSVPKRVTSGLANLLERYEASSDDWLQEIADEICVALDARPDEVVTDGDDLATYLEGLAWDEFCTACEVIAGKFSGKELDFFSNELNSLFLRQYLGYQMRNGEIERVGARVADEAIAQARGILRDPDLAAADAQYQKAINHYNRRPTPDCENAVKDAVGAVEGVIRLLSGETKALLPHIIRKIEDQKGIHPVLTDIFVKLYAYRGDEDGVSHGKVTLESVTPAEAEFVLGLAANAIVYIARLYGRAVENRPAGVP